MSKLNTLSQISKRISREDKNTLGMFGYGVYALVTIKNNDNDYVRNKLIHGGEVFQHIYNIPKPVNPLHKQQVLNVCFEHVENQDENVFYIISPFDRFYFLQAQEGEDYYYISTDFDIIELGNKDKKVINFISVSPGGSGTNDHSILL